MIVGVVHSKRMLQDVADLAIIGVGIAKKGISIGSLLALGNVLIKVRNIIVEAPQALPELADLDSQESGELAAAAYSAVKAIVNAIKA